MTPDEINFDCEWYVRLWTEMIVAFMEAFARKDERATNKLVSSLVILIRRRTRSQRSATSTPDGVRVFACHSHN
jgi:hypothetical protein